MSTETQSDEVLFWITDVFYLYKLLYLYMINQL